MLKMIHYFRFTLLFLLFLGWNAGAQTSREELLTHLELTAGNYANYPVPTGHLTPAPDGYEPFYISHHGRHGSRYMEDNTYYTYVIGKLDTLAQLGILTPKGAEARRPMWFLASAVAAAMADTFR